MQRRKRASPAQKKFIITATNCQKDAEDIYSNIVEQRRIWYDLENVLILTVSGV